MHAKMKAVAEIVKLNGGLDSIRGNSLTIELDPFMPLVIESAETPEGWDHVGVGFYFMQGDRRRFDPLLEFQVDSLDWESGKWKPIAMTTGIGSRLVALKLSDGRTPAVHDPKVEREIAEFATEFDAMLAGRYLPAARERVARGETVGVRDTDASSSFWMRW